MSVIRNSYYDASPIIDETEVLDSIERPENLAPTVDSDEENNQNYKLKGLTERKRDFALS